MNAQLRQPAQDHAEALGVVSVIVRDEDGVKQGGVETRLLAAREEVSFTDAAVNEDAMAGLRVFDDGCVSAASAGWR